MGETMIRMQDISPDQLKRAREEYKHICGEEVDVTFNDGRVYAFGTELAMLRLYHKHGGGFAGKHYLWDWVYSKEISKYEEAFEYAKDN
jgi:hypothetical protein